MLVIHYKRETLVEENNESELDINSRKINYNTKSLKIYKILIIDTMRKYKKKEEKLI